MSNTEEFALEVKESEIMDLAKKHKELSDWLEGKSRLKYKIVLRVTVGYKTDPKEAMPVSILENEIATIIAGRKKLQDWLEKRKHVSYRMMLLSKSDDKPDIIETTIKSMLEENKNATLLTLKMTPGDFESVFYYSLLQKNEKLVEQVIVDWFEEHINVSNPDQNLIHNFKRATSKGYCGLMHHLLRTSKVEMPII